MPGGWLSATPRDDDLVGLVGQTGASAQRRRRLQRAAQGVEDYLVVRALGGQLVAKMRAGYTGEAGTVGFSQLAVMGPLQGLGIATMPRPCSVTATCWWHHCWMRCSIGS